MKKAAQDGSPARQSDSKNAATSQKVKGVTVIQLAMAIGTAIIGVGLLAYPRVTVNYVMTAAPLTTAIAVFFGLWISLAIAYLGGKHPKLTIFEYGDQLVGKWIGGLIHTLIIINFLGLAAIAAREFGEVVVTSVLQRTPVEVTVLTMLILAATAARNTVLVVVRILTFYMPWVYFPALIIILLTLKSSNYINLLPLYHITHLKNLLMAAMNIIGLFQNIFIAGIIIPHMVHSDRAWKGVLVGVGSAGSLYIMLMTATLGIFGAEEMKHILWPTLDLAKTAALPGLFLERLDPIFIAVWVTAVFTGILSSYYSAIQGLAHVLRLRDHRILSTLVFPIIFMLALIPRNIANLYDYGVVMVIIGTSLTMVYPLLLLLFHLLKRGKKQKKGALQHA